ncbi:MAG: membrane protein insertase YidC [Crocinitomicaceae bacterium]|nr:membrane protein insertase YidC [Crocinitomicaceae bacterium]
MDKNTITGLVLIGIILSVFTYFNQPSEEELKAEAKKEQAKTDAAEAKKKKKSDKKEEEEEKPDLQANWEPVLDSYGEQIVEDDLYSYHDSVTNQDTLIPLIAETVSEPNTEPTPENKNPVIAIKDSIITLKTKKLEIDFSTRGGMIVAVRLPGFESYKNYINTKGNIALDLFQKGDASNGITIPINGKKLNTEYLEFSIKEHIKNKRIVFEYKGKEKRVIQFIYHLKDDAYDLDYDIKIRGFGSEASAKKVMFNWKTAFRKTERLFSEQRRVSTVCFNYKDEGFSYLSEVTNDYLKAEDKIEWVSFKQSYFSSFIQPKTPFGKSGSKFKTKNYDKDDEREWTNLKDFSTSLNLDLNNVNDATVSMNWYFGPNNYEILSSYDSGYGDVLNYGWGIFRWMNIYGIQPLFNILKSTGLSMGLVILLLTIIIKGLLMPVQWKMYTSSAKMRILKPEMEELAKKYPEKDDAMKKQMETMALYRESGASPLAGCVPMLIQMPILLAIFRFLPATFDLRQKSFLWAEDLSSFDSIADLPVDIWFYGSHISLFTLLMAATTLVYTHINSSNMQAPSQPGMPNMKVIMYFFPFMMIFFFNNYASGLSYYYFISTLMSILIMLMIKKFFVDEDKLKAKMAARKATASANGGSAKKKGKSKFQMRLEEMQKKQAEQRKKMSKK